MESARRAGTDDLPWIVALLEAEHAELRAERGGEMWVAHAADPTAARLAADLADPDALVLAGTIDDVVLGVLTARLLDAPGVGLVATIADLYVEPAAREVGVGAAMLDAVAAWAVAHDCAALDATVLPGTRQAKNFFEAHGLVARAISVHRRLTVPTPDEA